MAFLTLPRPASVLLSCLTLLCSLGAGAQDIVIGQCAPLSGSLATTGGDMALGVRIAVEAANASGGVNGRRIRLVQKDDGYVSDKTVACARELINQDRAVALIGFAGTGNVGELLKQKVLADAGIPLVAPYTGAAALREPFNPYIFHIRAGYADEAAKMVAQFAGVGLSRIAVFYQNDAFGQSGLAGVEQALAKFSMQPVARGSYEKNSENIDNAVRVIAETKPQAVIMIAISRPAALFVKKLRAVAAGVQVFSLSVVDAAEIYKVAGDEHARGIGITQVMPSPFISPLRIAREYRGDLEKYGKGATPAYASFEEYIGARVLIAALRKVSGTPTPTSVMRALEGLSLDVGGYHISFAPDRRTGSQFVEVTMITKDGGHAR